MNIAEVNLDEILNGVTAEAPTEKTSHLPSGDYNVIIEKITGKENAAGWKGLNFQLRVFGNRFNNYCLFGLVTILNPANKDSEAKGLKKLKKIKDILGVSDIPSMMGKKLSVDLGVVPDDYKINNGEVGAEKNIIWGYNEMIAMDNTPAPIKTDAAFTSDNIPF